MHYRGSNKPTAKQEVEEAKNSSTISISIRGRSSSFSNSKVGPSSDTSSMDSTQTESRCLSTADSTSTTSSSLNDTSSVELHPASSAPVSPPTPATATATARPSLSSMGKKKSSLKILTLFESLSLIPNDSCTCGNNASISNNGSASGSGSMHFLSSGNSNCSCSSHNTTRRRPRRRVVRYSVLEIQTYPLCLGDNPSVKGGFPLMLDYEQEPSRIQHETIDDYERQRSQKRRNLNSSSSTAPRPFHKFGRLTVRQRSDRLAHTSCRHYQPGELKTCAGKARRVQQQRSHTRSLKLLEPLEEGLELTLRAVWNATFRRRRKQQERLLMRPYLTTAITTNVAATNKETAVDDVSTLKVDTLTVSTSVAAT